MKKILDLYAELVPFFSGAGFCLLEPFDEVVSRVGDVSWYQLDATLDAVLEKNNGWIGVSASTGSLTKESEVVRSLIYKNNIVSLLFGSKNSLYRIIVGDGYKGCYSGVQPGDELLALGEKFDLIFNDADDEFLLSEAGKIISLVTDYRASLEHAPEQKIKNISIHDWGAR